MRKIKINNCRIKDIESDYNLDCIYKPSCVCVTYCAGFHIEERIGITGNKERQAYCKDHCIGELE